MTPFDFLRAQVRQQPDATAVSTPYRVASYRKMWSRIERSTARLQGEWAIRPGDTIVYIGCGHLDALVMYFAAARCGARLLALEHASLQTHAARWIAETGAVLVLHDDALALDLEPGSSAVACKPLSTLIATVCRFRESVQEDSAAISLLEIMDPEAGGAPGSDAASYPSIRPRSLDALAASALTCPAGHAVVRGALFDSAVFGPVVLAALLAGETLTFSDHDS